MMCRVSLAPGSSPARSDIASRDRLPSLTGLRFWAAALVVCYHLTHQSGVVQPFSALAWYGRTGVTFFFVLSGFVLAWTYLDNPTPFGVFLWRRFARLWPMVAVTGLLSLGVWAALGRPFHPWASLSTFTFLQAWRGQWAAGANPAAWSLSDEAFFYVLLPLLLTIAARRAPRRLLWGVLVVAMPVLFVWAWAGGWLTWRFDYFPPVRLGQFVVGVLCGVAVRRGARIPIRFAWALALVVSYHVVLYGLHLVSAATGRGSAVMYSGSHWWATLPFALLIVAAAQEDLAGRCSVLGTDWMLRLGHWSFAWYLVHEVCLRAMRALWRPETTSGVVAQWGALLVVSLGLAGALYTLVEHPAERWLRRLAQSRAPRPGPLVGETPSVVTAPTGAPTRADRRPPARKGPPSAETGDLPPAGRAEA